ncbi:KpsF/GutQ family sugar-phosphate isomerase [Flavobacterium aciduliphilum]|uniref:Arabinose-5-phosphate isomerase n=1 Tax=Flavobacterium aciduliphilum TaxID=1101402 RepID=A0A328Y801_9FLAO|nr:KpsF/GutQ family sugar-phosphate isomerase [Flavobacterium aciduliphilum]RAR70211.1 arabinose-5-phosphate isomerase [Flavobacterium aciduliphilum]
MIPKENILASAKKTILSESESIAKLADYVNDSFLQAIELLFHCKGRIIITGIGKSAIISQKIVATLNSTGSPALFLHASEAIHGDLGMIQADDVVICISKSGTSPEIKIIVPLLKRFGNKLIAITGNIDSFLGKEADVTLNTYVARESCPNNLAPTNSTTAQLVMGDALAVCLMEMKNFTAEDFAVFHPGGALGKKLLLSVDDLIDKTRKPSVSPNDSIKKAIITISEQRLGVTAVEENQKVIGIITDGDIRRMLNNSDTIAGLLVKDIMSKNPKIILKTERVLDALNTMEHFAITQLIVVDEANTYIGVIHLHDILKEGIV